MDDIHKLAAKIEEDQIRLEKEAVYLRDAFAHAQEKAHGSVLNKIFKSGQQKEAARAAAELEQRLQDNLKQMKQNMQATEQLNKQVHEEAKRHQAAEESQILHGARNSIPILRPIQFKNRAALVA